MRKWHIKEEVQEIVRLGEKLFQKRYEYAKNVKSPAFTMKELETTLNHSLQGKVETQNF